MNRGHEELSPIVAFATNIKLRGEVRAMVGRPKLNSDENGAVQLTKSAEKFYAKWTSENVKTFRDDMLKSSDMQASMGLPRTPAAATCDYLGCFGDSLAEVAATLLLQGGTNASIGAIQMDFERGFTIELGAVTSAAFELQRPQNEEDFLSRYDRRIGYSMLELATAEKASQRLLAQITRLLQEDPTGFSVLRYQIQRFEMAKRLNNRGILIRSYEVPDIVVAGAKFAQAKYQDLYSRVSAAFSTSDA